MEKKDIRVLALDLDGTLTNDQKVVTPATRAALDAAAAKGVTIVLASGRPTAGIMPLAKELGLDKKGGCILSYNGGAIIDCATGETLYRKQLDAKYVPQLCSFAREQGVVIITYNKQGVVTESPEDEWALKECFTCKLPMQKVGYIGFEIKPMAAIVMIAVAAVEGIHFIGKLLKKQIVWKKSVLACCLSAVLGIGAAAGGVSAVVDSLHFPVVTDTVLGWQHHMMLGLNKDTNGGYSQADFDYSTSFSSAEEQHAAELKEIGKRLKDFGIGGYLQHFVKKSARNYFDGCFGWGGLGETFYTEIFPERGTELCSLIRSLYYDNTEDTLYRYQALFRQILWYMVLVLVPFSVFTKRPLDKKRQVAVLSVLGLMLYLQIFEAHARYLYTFVPIFVFLATEGIDNLREYLNQKSERRVKK